MASPTASNTMDTISSSTSNEAPDPDTLFLVSRLLKSIPSLQGTYASLEKELNEGKLLGQVLEWRGYTRDATLLDLERKHETIPSDQLSALLHTSSSSSSRSTSMIDSTMNSHSSLTRESNILLPIRGVYNNNDLRQRSDAQRLTSVLISSLITLRAHHATIQKNGERMIELKALVQEKKEKEKNCDDANDANDIDDENDKEMDIALTNEEDVVILDNDESFRNTIMASIRCASRANPSAHSYTQIKFCKLCNLHVSQKSVEPC